MADLGAIAYAASDTVTHGGGAPLTRIYYEVPQTSGDLVFFDESDTISGTVQVEGTATEGLRVDLYYKGRRLRSNLTDGSGNYSFPGVSPALSYAVKIQTPNGANYNDAVYFLPATA